MALTRRHFVKGLGGAIVAWTGPSWVRAEAAETVTISIFHTTDLHGHILPTSLYDGTPDWGGLARCATQIRQWQKENPHSILLDVGDLYQGTEIGWRTRGGVMVEALNALQYDAWVVGNHELDWGLEPLAEAVTKSRMPVLAANCTVGGRPVIKGGGGRQGLGKLRPYFIKEVAGFKIGMVGVTTPGLPYWLPPEFLGELAATDPVLGVKAAVAELNDQGVDAIVVAGHMGLKGKKGDDFANRVQAVTTAYPEIAVYLAGHTHRSIPSAEVNGVLFTQANYYGTYCGRVDLTFDRSSRKLVKREAMTRPMDSTVALDPAVLALAQPHLETATQYLNQTAGRLEEALSITAVQGHASDMERLIGAAVRSALQKRKVTVEAVVHGTFDGNDWPAGNKTIGDLWKVLPYENFIVTAELTREELKIIAAETGKGEDRRGWMGLRPEWEGRKVVEIRGTTHQPMDPARRYRVAFNSYDAASGGQRFLALRALLEKPETQRTFHAVQSREALVEFFADKKTVAKSTLW